MALETYIHRRLNTQENEWCFYDAKNSEEDLQCYLAEYRHFERPRAAQDPDIYPAELSGNVSEMVCL